jgi:glycosyltransferase involved in cell wall biosynthesis
MAMGPEDELIVVDDGSTDNTRQILDPYLDRIRYVVGQNEGVGSARNRGIAVARHPLIAFNDSDDEWFADKLVLQRAFMERRPDVLFCFSDFALRDQNGAIVQSGIGGWYRGPLNWREILGASVPYSSITPLPQGRNDFPVYVGNMYLAELSGNCVSSQSLLVRRYEAGEALRFSHDLSWNEDHECVIRLAKIGLAAYFDCQTFVQCDHVGPRLTRNATLKYVSTRVTVIERTYGKDLQFLEHYQSQYRCVLEKYRLVMARSLLNEGDTAGARVVLRLVDDAPGSYRLLSVLPAYLVRSLLYLRMKLISLIGWRGFRATHPRAPTIP